MPRRKCKKFNPSSGWAPQTQTILSAPQSKRIVTKLGPFRCRQYWPPSSPGRGYSPSKSIYHYKVQATYIFANRRRCLVITNCRKRVLNISLHNTAHTHSVILEYQGQRAPYGRLPRAGLITAERGAMVGLTKSLWLIASLGWIRFS